MATGRTSGTPPVLSRPRLAAERKAFFDSQRLLTGYEAYTSSRTERNRATVTPEARLRKLDGKIMVFGVASWALSREHGLLSVRRARIRPDRPSIHAGLGDREAAMQRRERARRCDGATAIRCTTLDEGRPRVVRTHCAELDRVNDGRQRRLRRPAGAPCRQAAWRMRFRMRPRTALLARVAALSFRARPARMVHLRVAWPHRLRAAPAGLIE